MRSKHIGISLVGRSIADIMWLLLAYTIVGVSFYFSDIDPQTDWFRRSGSVMILLAVIIEYQNSTLQQQINERATYGSGAIGGGVAPLNQPQYRRWIINSAHFTVVLGALVAGYGDLILDLF